MHPRSEKGRGNKESAFPLRHRATLCSSVGSALHLQCQGSGFNSHWGPVQTNLKMYAVTTVNCYGIRLSAKNLIQLGSVV